MSFNATALRAGPSVLRAAQRSLARSRPRRLPSGHVSAIAILIPRHTYATETSNSTSSGAGVNLPPPGFNATEAKKPPPKGAQPQASKKSPIIPLPTVDQSTMTQATAIPKAFPTEGDAQSFSQLAAEKASADTAESKQLLEKRKGQTQLTMWQKVKKEASHYWDGTKLLATEVKISSKLALKMAAGYELTRREDRQLQRTVKDLSRLVPFSVFIIVPFAEFLLPVALKLFPNLLPSTYEVQKTRDARATNLRATRKEVSTLLRNTLRETGLPVSAANTKKEEFMIFFRKIRTTGESPTKDDVIKVCRTFKDDLTLDNLSRPQLVGICRYMNLNTFGTDALLRYHIRHRMRQIKRDDKAIAFEGVESLSVPELQMACASRGLHTYGVSPGRLRDDLQMWLDLRLKYGVPSTLLVLSNAFVYSQGGGHPISGSTSSSADDSPDGKEMHSQIEALQAVLSSIPEELFHEIELELHSAEGAATNKQRLEVLREQQELIEEENAQSDEGRESGAAAPKDDIDIDEKEDSEVSATGGDAEGKGEVHAQGEKGEK